MAKHSEPGNHLIAFVTMMFKTPVENTTCPTQSLQPLLLLRELIWLGIHDSCVQHSCDMGIHVTGEAYLPMYTYTLIVTAGLQYYYTSVLLIDNNVLLDNNVLQDIF